MKMQVNIIEVLFKSTIQLKKWQKTLWKCINFRKKTV